MATVVAGEWEVSDDHKSEPYIIREKGRFGGFAKVRFIGGWLPKPSAKPQKAATVRLMAMGPELLAACEQSLSTTEIDADDAALALEALSAIRAILRPVIAKANS